RCEEPQVLNEQHRVDRHVEQRIGPGEPTVPEPPEAAERPLDPLVVATLDGQHRGQLADEQRFGNTVDEWRRDQQQQRDPGAHRADQPLQTERPARHGEEHHRHEWPEAEGGRAAGHWCMWSCSAPQITFGSSLSKAMTCTIHPKSRGTNRPPTVAHASAVAIGDLGPNKGFPSRVSRHRSRWPTGGRHQFTCSCHRATERGTRWSSASSEVRAGAVYIAPASTSAPPGPSRYRTDGGLVGSNRRAAKSAQRQLVKW